MRLRAGFAESITGPRVPPFFTPALVSNTRPPIGDFRVVEWHAKHFAASTGRILFSKKAVSGDCAIREAHHRPKMKYRVILPRHPRLLKFNIRSGGGPFLDSPVEVTYYWLNLPGRLCSHR